jgi:hypothetical protein
VPVAGVAPNEMDKGSCVTVADLVGDFRDEVVIVGPTDEGGMGVFVYMSTTPLTTRMTARTAERAYRLWLARNLTGGYWSHFEPRK